MAVDALGVELLARAYAGASRGGAHALGAAGGLDEDAAGGGEAVWAHDVVDAPHFVLQDLAAAARVPACGELPGEGGDVPGEGDGEPREGELVRVEAGALELGGDAHGLFEDVEVLGDEGVAYELGVVEAEDGGGGDVDVVVEAEAPDEVKDLVELEEGGPDHVVHAVEDGPAVLDAGGEEGGGEPADVDTHVFVVFGLGRVFGSFFGISMISSISITIIIGGVLQAEEQAVGDELEEALELFRGPEAGVVVGRVGFAVGGHAGVGAVDGGLAAEAAVPAVDGLDDAVLHNVVVFVLVMLLVLRTTTRDFDDGPLAVRIVAADGGAHRGVVLAAKGDVGIHVSLIVHGFGLFLFLFYFYFFLGEGLGGGGGDVWEVFDGEVVLHGDGEAAEPVLDLVEPRLCLGGIIVEHVVHFDEGAILILGVCLKSHSERLLDEDVAAIVYGHPGVKPGARVAVRDALQREPEAGEHAKGPELVDFAAAVDVDAFVCCREGFHC